MADENYIETYIDGETGKEGVYIKGKDAVALDAPEIPLSGDIDLPETENRELIAILKELFQSGGGGGDPGVLRGIIDTGSSLKLISAYTPEGAENEQYADHDYTYTEGNYSETIITKTTADGVTTTHTQTFSKTAVTELFDPAGVQILRADYNENTGDIGGYYGRDDEEIHLYEWRTEYEEYASHLNEDAAAIAWCICKNNERSDSFDKQKQLYRKGLFDGTDYPGGIRPEEKFTEPINELNGPQRYFAITYNSYQPEKDGQNPLHDLSLEPLYFVSDTTLVKISIDMSKIWDEYTEWDGHECYSQGEWAFDIYKYDASVGAYVKNSHTSLRSDAGFGWKSEREFHARRRVIGMIYWVERYQYSGALAFHMKAEFQTNYRDGSYYRESDYIVTPSRSPAANVSFECAKALTWGSIPPDVPIIEET